MSNIVHLRNCEKLKNSKAYKWYQYFKTFPETYTRNTKVHPYPFLAISKRITFPTIHSLSCDFQFNYVGILLETLYRYILIIIILYIIFVTETISLF